MILMHSLVTHTVKGKHNHYKSDSDYENLNLSSLTESIFLLANTTVYTSISNLLLSIHMWVINRWKTKCNYVKKSNRNLFKVDDPKGSRNVVMHVTTNSFGNPKYRN